jgi:Rrf2 family protein
MISTKGRYALRIMLDIAQYQKDHVVSINDISKREDISLKYIEQVIRLLLKNDLLISFRGKNGGYRLKKDISDYNIYEILEAVELTMSPVECLKSKTNSCKRCTYCKTLSFWKEYNLENKKYLKGKKLVSLL